MTTRPVCRCCGRKLRTSRGSRDSVAWGPGEHFKAQSAEHARRLVPDGAKVTRVLDRGDYGRVLYVGPEVRFGDYGDGHFCGLTCGYRFAVRALGGRKEGTHASE